VDVGQPVLVAALSSGGVGPFTYIYGGLPTGCAAVDQLSFRCVPAAAGAFSVEIGLADQLGGLASGSAPLTVNPDPAVTSFTTSASVVTVGGSFELAVQVAGGTAPFVYLYSGLPAGCVGAGASELSCWAAVAGNYSVTVMTVDATGARATAVVSLTVAVGPSVTPPHPGSTPGHNPSAASTPWYGAGYVAFALGIAVGLLALVATALWARRRMRRMREGEAIVASLEGRPGTAGAFRAGASSDAEMAPRDL
jgi:hypothetical protein